MNIEKQNPVLEKPAQGAHSTSQRLRKNQFLFRFDDKEKTRIEEIKTNLKYRNQSQMFRDFINDEFIYVNLYRDLFAEARKQGNNLNQIARYANENKNLDDVVLKELQKIEQHYKELLDRVRKL